MQKAVDVWYIDFFNFTAQETDVIDLIEDISCALYDFKDGNIRR